MYDMGTFERPYKHRRCFLALLLLVLRVLADNHNLALTANDLALLADRLYRRSYLHVILPPSNFWWDGTPETCPADHWRAGHMRTSARFFILLGTPSDTTAGQVVRRHLNGDLVAGKNADKVHAELARDMRQNLMAVGSST